MRALCLCPLQLVLLTLLFLFLENALGLCHVLSRPCPKPKPQIWDLSPLLRDQWEIDHNEIQLIRKLGQGNFGEVWYGEWLTVFLVLTLKNCVSGFFVLLFVAPHMSCYIFIREMA